MATRGDDQTLTSAEYRSFKKHFADLSDGIQNPTSLANRMFSADLLSRDTRRRISELPLTEQKVSTLLDVTETIISLDPQNFYKFVVELEKDSPMQHLCDKLRFTCVLSAFGVPPTARSSLVIKKKPTRSPILQPTLQPNTSVQQIREYDSMLPFSSCSSHHSTTTVTRNQYRMFLKDCYRQPLPDDDKLLTTASKHYIELAIISREGITRKEADEFTKKSLHGLTEEILHKKSPIALKDILNPREDGKPVRCVLVEGAPGIGKSTLAWEVCHKWEKLDCVKHSELLVLVRLREKKSQGACCLEDLLPCGATINKKELVAAIGRGKGVFVICDGFDELPREQRQEGSVYIELLKGRLLPEATIIITSRPSVSADLWRLCQHNIDRHLEVIGFTKEDIKRFAESVFSGDILNGFLSYITSNPPIYGMMYIPLNAVIVALIYQDSYDTDTPFPTTMTQLFDGLTRALIRRHLVSSCYKIDMPSSLRCIEDVNKLPPLVSRQLLELARVAYVGWRKNRYVFTDLSDDFEGLGMMKKTTSLNVCTGRECSYTFLHLTFQEYMAALYIAIVCPSDLDWSSFESFKHDVVLRFLAGMCNEHNHCYKDLVKLIDYFLDGQVQYAFVGNRCDCGSSIGVLQLVHCAYECPSIIQGINTSNIKGYCCIEPDVSFDWYVTGYCISHFNVEWGLSTKHATDENIDHLVKGLRSSSTAKGRINVLHVHPSKFSPISQIINRKYCELNSICLFNVSIDKDEEVILCQLIELQSRLRRVDYCHSAHFGQSITGTGLFIPLLLGLSSLEELSIQSSKITINTELLPHSNTNLKKLSIPGRLIQPLATLLLNITSLTYLRIDGKVTDSDISVLITTVKSLPMLKVLDLKDTDSCLDFSELVVAAGDKQLNELRLDSYHYDTLPQHIQEQYNYMVEHPRFF